MTPSADDPTVTRATDPRSDADLHPEFDFDGQYRVERVGDEWYLRGPAFCEAGGLGMRVDGRSPDVLAKYRDLADLLNAAVAAERRRR